MIPAGADHFALFGEQLFDLLLGAPHRHLFLDVLQPDQFVDAGLRLGQYVAALVGQDERFTRSPAGFGARVPLVGAGGNSGLVFGLGGNGGDGGIATDIERSGSGNANGGNGGSVSIIGIGEVSPL